MRAAKRDAKIADVILNRPKKLKAWKKVMQWAAGCPWTGRRVAAVSRGQPATMPREQNGACINPKRRENRKIAALFLEEHGRRMNRKDWKHRKHAQITAEREVAAAPEMAMETGE